ncbi:AHH domain-containing protein, partial [Photorhabdus luminescens]
MPCQRRRVNAMARHQGNHHRYTDAIRNALDKINLNQSTDAISKQ